MYKYVLFNRRLQVMLCIIEATSLMNAEDKLANKVTEKQFIDAVKATNPGFDTSMIKEAYKERLSAKYILINVAAI